MNFVTKEPINKGWSRDKKYCVTDENGNRYLLRVSDIAEHDTKRSEFDMMKQVAALGVPMCKPLEFGTCEDGVYSIQSWIDGEDAEEVISRYSDTEQYVFGIEAGRILRKIHSIPAPSTMENWESRFNRKMDYKIQRYNECPYKYDNGQAFIDYIEAYRHLLHGRPQTYQHGDYHIGNMMIGNDGKLYIIDFNRNDFGDPWEELNRIVWCAGKAPHFASGIVNGYFDNAVPLEFWKLLALYISSNTLSSLPWAIPFGESEVEKFQEQAKEVLEWYDGMKNPVPSWYCMPQKVNTVMEHMEKLIGKCGFYCGACPTYLDGNCLGCVEEHKEGDCYTRDCVLKSNIQFCGECKNFPCNTILTEPHTTVLDKDWLKWKKNSNTNR